ncbi:MAG: VOC family protein [Dehalococcoidia bacterium]
MWLRLRQIALAARDIEAAVEDLRAVFGLEVGFTDPEIIHFGLQNRLLPIGTQFLEIVSPVQPGTTAERFLERRGGDGGYMVICQCDDHPPRRRRVEELGIRTVAPREEPTYSLMQLHPRDTGGSFLEIDRHTGADEPVPPWTHAAGANWQHAVRTDVIRAITAAEIQSPDPFATARRWSEIVEIPVSNDRSGAATIPLQNATLRFVSDTDGRGEGLADIDVDAVDRDRGALRDDGIVYLVGMRFRIV